MNSRLISIVLAIILMFSLTACNRYKDKPKDGDEAPAFTSYEKACRISGSDSVDTKFKVTAGEKDGSFTLKITGENINQEIEIEGDRSAFLAQKLITFDDINFDGYKDVIISKSGFSSSSQGDKLQALVFGSEESKYILGRDEFSTYKLIPASKSLHIRDDRGGATGEDKICIVEADGSLREIRSLEYGQSSDKKYFVKVTDFSDAGTLLLFNGKFSKSDYESINRDELILVGLDGNSVTLSSALKAVENIVGKGAFVDCEGIYKKDGAIYYRMRVDKNDVTSAYYSVKSTDGTVELLQGGSHLI